MFAAEYEPARDDRHGRRRASRSPADGVCGQVDDGLARALCKVVNLSALGVRIQTYTALRRGAVIWLTLPGVGRVAAEVRWVTDFTAGCEFHAPLSARQFKALTAIDV